ncbi:hypothetical protein BASA81_007995 [Batrachochytrium salamandrivorans]|nr:hypothetical protein BASA81_007995 [Batrachochytrium salamandrivorans]
MHQLLAFALVAWGGLFSPCPAAAAELVFSPCPADVVTYFQSYYPEYRQSNEERRRRLQTENEGDFESQLFDRAKFKSAFPATPSADSMASLKAEPINTDTLSNSQGMNPPKVKRVDSFLPPPNAWVKTKMAITGCTSCTNGCCDAADIVLDCGRMNVPLDYANPGMRNISIMTYRIRIIGEQLAPAQRTQLWMLQGGPGGSGLSILFIAVPSLQFASEIYIPDHRGTGLSSTLTCPSVVSNLGAIPSTSAASCVANARERDALGTNRPVDPKFYSVTNAAKDLGALINSQKVSGVPTYVHAYSYGTRWASRFLQLFPGLVTKVVLEGNVAKDTVFNDFAAGSQAAGARFMEKCQLDSTCSKMFTTSVSAQITSIAQEGNTNPCTNLYMGTSTLYSEATIRMQIQQLLFQGLSYGVDGPYIVPTGNDGTSEVFVDFRTVFLSLVSRWARCRNDEANYRVFAAGMAWYLSLNGGYVSVAALDTANDFSNLVYEQIVCSELRRYPVESNTVYNALSRVSEWGVYDTYANYVAESFYWQKLNYSKDAFMGLAPQAISANLLILNGEIDGNTFASQAMENFHDITSTVGKKIAIAPDAGHHASGSGCGLQIAKSFYQNTTHMNCGEAQDMNQPTLPLETQFLVPDMLSSVIIGSPPTPFTGDVSNAYCMNPPTASPTSGGATRYCRKCFDYCLFLTFVQQTSDCDCAQNYGACLQRGNVMNPLGECYSFLSAYGSKLKYSPYLAGGKCRPFCSTGISNGFTTTSMGGIRQQSGLWLIGLVWMMGWLW